MGRVAGVGTGGVTARDPESGVLRANGATPGVGLAGVGARAGASIGARGAAVAARGVGRATGVAAARPSLKSFSIAPP